MALSKAEIAEHMSGTCLSAFEGAQQMGITEDEVLEACAEHEVQQCHICDWWQEPGEWGTLGSDVICEDCANT